jgi:hypothetical protein
MWHKNRSPAAVVREWRMPGPERRAARAERRAEAQMRRERDSQWSAEQRADRLAAESRRYSNYWAGGD